MERLHRSQAPCKWQLVVLNENPNIPPTAEGFKGAVKQMIKKMVINKDPKGTLIHGNDPRRAKA